MGSEKPREVIERIAAECGVKVEVEPWAVLKELQEQVRLLENRVAELEGHYDRLRHR